MKVRETEAVKVKGREARLEVSYKLIRDRQEYSDSNTFTEVVGGREDRTEIQAKQECVKAAQGWVNNLRAEGWEVSAWDESGNCY